MSSVLQTDAEASVSPLVGYLFREGIEVPLKGWGKTKLPEPEMFLLQLLEFKKYPEGNKESEQETHTHTR